MASADIRAAMKRVMAENKPNSGNRPPNLTVTEDTHVNCGTCIHWSGTGTCRLYQYRTSQNQVCDSWSPQPK